MDSTEVVITKHKKKLEKIRNERQDREQSRDDTASTIRLFQTTTEQDKRNTSIIEGSTRHANERDSGIESVNGIARQSNSSIRRTLTTNEYPTTSDDRTDQPIGEATLTAIDSADKADRQRELTRQRVARFRQREKEKGDTFLDNDTSQAQKGYVTATQPSNLLSFNLKKGNDTPVKLLTKTEVEEHREAMIFVYEKGSSIIDDIIQIITVGHDEVHIWAMDKDEATIFADAHLKSAMKDSNAARSARMLLKIHDRLFQGQYFLTRTIATSRHIKKSGGLSFK